eukprot:1135671_1
MDSQYIIWIWYQMNTTICLYFIHCNKSIIMFNLAMLLVTFSITKISKPFYLTIFQSIFAIPKCRQLNRAAKSKQSAKTSPKESRKVITKEVTLIYTITKRRGRNDTKYLYTVHNHLQPLIIPNIDIHNVHRTISITTTTQHITRIRHTYRTHHIHTDMRAHYHRITNINMPHIYCHHIIIVHQNHIKMKANLTQILMVIMDGCFMVNIKSKVNKKSIFLF